MGTQRTISLRRRRLILAGVSVAAGIAIIVTGWAMVRGRGAGPARPVLLVVSGDTDGWITPCGCTANQSGGLPRRASYLSDLRRTHEVLYADAGGVVDGTTAYHALKAQAIFRGAQDMHIVAQNLGAAELALGPATLRDLAQSTGIPLVSANVTSSADAGDSAPVPASRIVTAGKLRVAFIGVVSPAFATPDWHVREPRAAILSTIDSIRGQYDRLVVLAYLHQDELEALARDLPEADAVIGGPTGQSFSPQRVGGAGTLLASATNKGKFVLESSFDAAVPAHIVELTGHFADEPDQLANVARYRGDLRAKDFPADTTGLARAAAQQGHIAGTASCQSCHEAEFAVWSKTDHAHAWTSLTSSGAEVDPSCQVCHTTGYAAPGGFLTVAASAARTQVGCEDCHGPSAAHVADPAIHTPFLARSQCLACHDQENSPAFDIDAYWEKIRHGPTATAPGKEATP